jgi:hypothetical protein
VTRVDADNFTIPVPFGAAAGTASWQSLRSTVLYDPRGSVFNGSPVGTTFTLDGLAQGQTFTDAWTYTMFDGSMVFANDDMFRVASDSTNVVLKVFANDVDLTGLTGAINIIAVGTPSQRGTASLGADNTITYTPETNFAGDEYFTYTVVDALGNTDTALVTVRVTIEQLNGNLQANRDAFTVAKGQSPLLAVLANDDLIPATGAALSITRISTAPNAGGTAVPEGSGIRYTPAMTRPAYPYAETFAYEISGGGTARAIAIVSIMVANRENTLALRADAVSVQAGSSNNVLNVLANDNVLPGSGLDLLITATSAPNGGSVQISADQKRLLFTPNAGFLGASTFTYIASDTLGGTGIASVSVAVGGLTTNNDFFTVPSAAIPVTLDVLANDRVLGSPGNISIKPMGASVTPIGTLSAVAAGASSLTFTPVAGQTGERTFAYRIVDGTGREAAGSVTVFVSLPGLLANSDFFTVQAGSLSNPLNVLLNDAQIPDLGQPKTIVGIGTGSDAPDQGGTVLVNAAGTGLLYTPGEGFSGEERFTYSVTNGDVTAVAQVVVRVTSGALIAADDAFSVFKGSSAMRLEVLANDRVIPGSGQTLTITGIGIVNNAPGRQGTVAPTGDGGALLYTPNASNTVYPYTETFTYEISDGTARRAQGTVTMQVLDRAGVREMETNDDSFTILAGAQNVLLAVLANDDIRPASANGWEITGLGPRSQGGAAAVSGGGIAYTPAAGFVGTDTFTYTVTDGLGGTGAATVTVKVGDVMVSDDSFTVLSGSGSTALAVLANDGLFPDGLPGSGTRPGLAGFSLDLAPMTPNRGGTATVSGDQILYRPAANFSGSETFTYWVRDDSGIRFPGQVTVNVEPAGSDRSAAALAITVTGVNDPPLILGTSLNPIGDKQTTRPFSGVTIRDVDDQLKELITVRIRFPAAHGALSGAFNLISPGLYQFIGNGSQATAAIRTLVYTPVENRIIVAGTEETSFAVSLQDPFITTPVMDSTSAAAVTAVNDAPVLTGTKAGQRVYLNSGIAPFEGVRIADVDDLAGQSQIVTITIDNAIKGNLTNLGGFIESPPGTYIRIGTPSQVTSAIRGLIFTPTPENRVTPGSPETVNFTITVNDGFAPALTDSITTVIVQHPFMKKLLPLTLAGTDASQTGASYGADVDISGDTLVVGSELLDGTLVNSGAVHVYERQSGGIENWGQAARLAPADLAAGDSFGGAVALDGDFLAVAADRQTVGGIAGAGVVYIFQRDALDRNAWKQVAKVSEPVGERNAQDNFGEAVALHGTTLLVGAPYANQPLADSGAVFVFEKNKDGVNAWGFTQKLLPTAGVGERAAWDQFGFSVAIEGNLLAVGAYGVDRITPVPGTDFGAVYLFERPNPAGTWAQSAKVQIFNEPGASASDLFGCELDLSGNTLVVGACGYDRVVGAVTHLGAGAAFVFERNQGGNNNWGLSKPLFAPEPAAEDWFGHSVGLARDLVLVGAPKQINSTHPLSKAGYAGVFRRQQAGAGNWGLLEVLQPAGAGQNDLFGFNCGLDRFSAVIGANLNKINVSDEVGEGASYVYEFKFNNAPALAQPIPNQAAKPDVAFLFPVPAGTFSDADDGDVLTYQATLANGNAIPAGSWLQFTPASATFSGTPTLTNYHPLSLIIKASDEQGLTVGSNVFTISVDVDRGRTFGLAFEKWQQAHFTPAVLANPALESTTFGSNANPDRDPYSNLLEMALGLDPNATNPPGLITLEVNAPLVTLVYPLANDFPAGFSRVEWSLDLTTWREINVSTTVRTQLANYRMLASSAFPPIPSGKIYLRLRVGP